MPEVGWILLGIFESATDEVELVEVCDESLVDVEAAKVILDWMLCEVKLSVPVGLILWGAEDVVVDGATVLLTETDDAELVATEAVWLAVWALEDAPVEVML